MPVPRATPFGRWLDLINQGEAIMKRKIVTIHEEKCNGCGLCITACHEGALRLVNGKAKLVSDDCCDGLGACLPDCPTGAIEIVEREAVEFDEKAVESHRSKSVPDTTAIAGSQLKHWPVQIKLVPVNAPYFHDADLLIAADCTAFAYANFHNDFLKNRIVLIGCPKLDQVDYAEKLTEIFRRNEIRKVTVLRMEVPCCGGIVRAAETAIINSQKEIPCTVVIVGTKGEILDTR